MQHRSNVFSFAVVALLMATACAQPKNEVGQRTSTASARRAADAGVVEANTTKNLKDKAVDNDTKGADGTDDVDDGKGDPDDVIPGKGGKDVPGKDGETIPGKGGEPIPGKGDSDDDVTGGKDPGKGPGQTPNQNPHTTPSDPIDEPDVVVDLPKEACPYFDPAKPTFVIKKDQFAPGLPPIDIPSSHVGGTLEADNETFIAAFTLFQVNATAWTLVWDGKKGRIPHDYTMVVVGASNSECTAYLKLVKQEPRTLNGCFAANTKIRMANGKDQIIAAITVGDMVLNPVTKLAAKVAEVRKGPEKRPMWSIGFAGHEMVVTELHPVPVLGGLKQAHDVTTNDYIFDANGIIQRVTAAKALPVKANETVFNIRLEGSDKLASEHMIQANGVISGDLYLQRKLAGEGAQTAAAK